MNKAKINELYEKAYVTYEVPYESSVVDPTIVSIHKQRVWDRHLFAELIVRECIDICRYHPSIIVSNNWSGHDVAQDIVQRFEEHFGVEE